MKLSLTETKNGIQPITWIYSICFFIGLAMSLQTGIARAELPVTGVPITELEIFDNYMQSFMEDNGLEGGILGVSFEGCVIYQRGFGYAYNMSDPLPENSPMRLASVEKPLTAAMIRYLIADGIIDLDDFVFDVGQWSPLGERRLLDAYLPSSTYYPYDGVLGDARFAEIRVRHLLLHRGGWDRATAYDPFSTGKTLEIGALTGSNPPGRQNIVRYMMSEPLQFPPGLTDACVWVDDVCTEEPSPCVCDGYSNYGYMLLSLIIEQETGGQHTNMLRQRVLTPDMWVPSTEIIFGRTFRAYQSPREPRYISGSLCTNVYNPSGFPVLCPYGGFDMESKTGEGNLVGSAAPLLTFLDRYAVDGSGVGVPISSARTGWKNGGLDGTSTMVRQYDDGFNVVVLLNEGGGHASTIAADIYTLIQFGSGVDWSTLSCIDGSWVDFDAGSSGFGGFNDSFHSMDAVKAAITDGTKLRIKPGTSNWTGTISTKTLISAPLGTAVIGQ